ncbi:MAG: DNA mismatch repair protein MutS [Deltaproteobacteria bacterium]|nr:DNA mismatch repair protein MutS [Deltaproteobacteria bacterium]
MGNRAGATPMLEQYWRIKAEHPDPDTILFFRLGDFYEMFFDDAQIASKILDITLTTRNKHDPHPVPLCGVPYHAAEGYIARLIQAGKKVAICEQVEDPKTAKGVVKRDVLRVVTPGAVLAPESLQGTEHNYLVAAHGATGPFGLAVIDISTGDFRATTLGSLRALTDEVERLEPREVLVTAQGPRLTRDGMTTTQLPDDHFAIDALPTLAGLAHVERCAPAALPAVAAIWRYLQYTNIVGARCAHHVAAVEPYQTTDYLIIDDVTKRNLELCRTMTTGQRHGSLLWHLDRTMTPMGARLLKEWLCYPLRHCAGIEARQDAIAQWLADVGRQQACQQALAGIADLARIAGRLMTQQGNARDLIGLRNSLAMIPALQAALAGTTGLLGEIAAMLDPCDDVVTRITDTLVDDPPFGVHDGRLIRDRFDPALDALRTVRSEGKGFIARLEAQERQRTGISSLKVRFNKVFGYYIEVTHAHREKVPADYLRKQTLTNAERFMTPELKQYEETVVTAEERIKAIEYAHLVALRDAVMTELARIKRNTSGIAQCDVLLSLALVAQEGRYCRPALVDAPVTVIREGRHPVIERLVAGEAFVPNDCTIDARLAAEAPRLLIITGPNMAGKSTLMRQVGVMTLMAQMGGFVPATEATVGLVDRIFTRVGASDNLGRGQSTFMVEMAEAATILREATAQSLILIDELGRGTSTYDGISIAWAVAEYLNHHVKGRTLFATHYHELAALADNSSTMANWTMAVKEWNDQIIFLRTLVPGAANRSYGIQVAELAGLPSEVTARAKAVLADLEAEGLREHHQGASGAGGEQYALFQPMDPVGQVLRERLRGLDPEQMTPMAALQCLAELVAYARS